MTKNLLPHHHITDNYSNVNEKCELYLTALSSKKEKVNPTNSTDHSI